GYRMSRFFLIRGAATPRLSSRTRSTVVDVIAGSQVMFQAEASSLAADQISYPTPSNALDTPLPTPTPLAPITASLGDYAGGRHRGDVAALVDRLGGLAGSHV